MSEIKKGTTGRSEYFRMTTASGTPFGGALAGLASGANVASLRLAYTRDRSLPISSLCSALSSEGAAHSGFKVFELFSGFAANSNYAPGIFRADVPDSAYVTGVDKVTISLTCPALGLVSAITHELKDNVTDDVANSVSSLHTRVGSLSVQVGSIDVRVSSSATFAQAAALTDAVSSLHTRVGSVDARVGSAAVQVGSLFTLTGSIQMAVNSWVGDRGIFITSAFAPAFGVDSLHTRVASLSTQVGSVAVQVGSVQVGVDSLQAFVNSNVGLSGIGITSASISGGASVTVGDINSAALARFFTRATDQLGADAVSGSVVREIWRNAAAGTVDYTGVGSAVWGSSSAQALTNRLSSMDVRVASVAVQVGSLYARVGEAAADTPLAAQVGSLSTRVGSIDTRVGSLATMVGSAMADLTSIHAETALIFARANSIDVRVGSLATLTGSLYARVGEPAADTALSTQVASLSTRVGSVAIEAGSISTAVGSLHTRVSSAQVGIDSTFSSLGSLHTRVGSVATEAGSIFTAASSLQVALTNVQSRLPTALSGAGRMLSDMVAVNSDANAAEHFRVGVRGTVTGIMDNGSTPGNLVTGTLTPAAATAQQFKGRIVTFERDTITAALRGQATDILSSSAGGVLGVTSLTTAPASGDRFAIT